MSQSHLHWEQGIIFYLKIKKKNLYIRIWLVQELKVISKICCGYAETARSLGPDDQNAPAVAVILWQYGLPPLDPHKPALNISRVRSLWLSWDSTVSSPLTHTNLLWISARSGRCSQAVAARSATSSPTRVAARLLWVRCRKPGSRAVPCSSPGPGDKPTTRVVLANLNTPPFALSVEGS